MKYGQTGGQTGGQGDPKYLPYHPIKNNLGVQVYSNYLSLVPSKTIQFYTKKE